MASSYPRAGRGVAGISEFRDQRLAGGACGRYSRRHDEKQHTVAQICQLLGISKPTLYKYLASEKEMGQGSKGSAGT